MKKLLLIVLSLLLIIGCSKPIDDDSLVERNGIHYQVNSETPYNGKSFSLHDNGQKYYERTYKDGKKNGLSTKWYQNGQKKFETTFKDEKWDGLFTKWYENGQKKYERTMKVGEIINIVGRWNEDGSVRKEPFEWEIIK